MAVRETLELDLTRALADVNKLDARLQAAFTAAEADARKVGAALNQGITGSGLESLDKGITDVGTATADTATKTEAYGESLDTVNKKAKDHTESLRAMSTQAVVTGTAILGAFGLAIKASIDLESSLAPVGTLLGASTAAGHELTAALKDVIANSPQSADEIGASAYTILSAGIQGTTNVLETLRASQKLSEAGLGTLSEATGLVTSALAVFSGEGLTAQKAAEILFGTISLGKTTTAGLAEGFGQIAPLAASAGVSFHDLLSATAALTATGQTASIAYTGLRGILTGILNPTKEAATAAKQLGIEFSVGHLQQVGLAKFLDEVRTATGGSVEQMTALFGSVEGLNAALTLTGPQAAAFAKNLAGIDDAGKNLNSRAKEIEDTVGNKLATAFNKLKVDLAQAIAPIVPFLEAGVSALGAFGDAITALPQGTQTAGAGLIALVGAGTLLFGVIAKVNLALNTARDFLVGFEGSSQIANRATTVLGNNLGLLARSVTALAIFPILGQQLEQVTGDFISAGAASGALAGTMISPGAGTIIGATLGAIAGKFGILGEKAELTTAQVHALGVEIDQLGSKRAAQTFLDALSDDAKWKLAQGNIDGVRTAIRRLATEDPAAARKVLEGLNAEGFLTVDQFGRLAIAVDNGSAAFSRHKVAAKDAADANKTLDPTITAVAGSADGAATTFDVLTGEMTDAQTAAEDFSKALNDLESDLLGLPGAAISLEQALISQRKAQEDLNKVRADGTSTADQIREAELRVEEANLRVAKATIDLGAEQAKLNDALGGSTEVLGAERQHLLDLQAQFPESAAALQPFIDKLDEAARLRIIAFLDNIEEEKRRAQEFLNFLASIGLSSQGFLAIQFQPPSNPDQPLQTGGPVPGAVGRPVSILAHGGEFVLSADVVSAIKRGGPTEGLAGSTAASPISASVTGRGAQPLIGTLIVQGETPNAVKVAKETSREARAFMFLGGAG